MQVAGDLVDAARSGDRDAAERLIEFAWPHAYRIAFSIVRERESAQDAAQDACAIAYRTIGQLRAAQAFHVWFYRIVMRQATILERKATLRRALEHLMPDRPDPIAAILRIDVLNALARLPRAQRACVVLHFYAQMNSREIGEVLGMPDGTVRFHFHRAKRALAAMLGDADVCAPLLEKAHAV
jgi:RNA polymerase sigma-70 factor (ECF subfamily)